MSVLQTTENASIFESTGREIKKVLGIGRLPFRNSFCSNCGRYGLTVGYLSEHNQLGIHIYDFSVKKFFQYGRFEKDLFKCSVWTHWFEDAVVIIGLTDTDSISQFLVEMDHERRVARLTYVRRHNCSVAFRESKREFVYFASEVSAWSRSYTFLSGSYMFTEDMFMFFLPRDPRNVSITLEKIRSRSYHDEEMYAYSFTVAHGDKLFSTRVLLNDNNMMKYVPNRFAETSLAAICQAIDKKDRFIDFMAKESEKPIFYGMTEDECVGSHEATIEIYQNEQVMVVREETTNKVLGCYIFDAEDSFLEKIGRTMTMWDVVTRHSSGILLLWTYNQQGEITVEKLKGHRQKMRSLQDICRQNLLLEDKIKGYEHIMFG